MKAPGASAPIRAVAIVIPAHDEEALIGACLSAVSLAGRHPDVMGIEIRPLVVLDDCTDGTADACTREGVRTVAANLRSVGLARALGFSLLADELRRESVPLGDIWLATTDADTRVSPDWLAVQVEAAGSGADAVFGVVDVDDWSDQPAGVANEFALYYDGIDRRPRSVHPHVAHTHVHGANLGLRLETYLRAGGMPGLAVGEDQALSDRLDLLPGVQVTRTTALRATTSARRTSRVRGGFADLLRSLSAPEHPAVPASP